jgi:hypothetical protein
MKKHLLFTAIIFLCIAAWGFSDCGVTFTQPEGGKSYRLGTGRTIVWQQTAACSGNILLKLVRNTGWSATIISVPASALSQDWTVGDNQSGTATAGDGYQIKCVHVETGASCGESGVFRILPRLASTNVQPMQPQFQREETPPVHAMQFDRIDHGNVILLPNSLNIRYGAETLTLASLATGLISIPEGSPLINANGSVRTTVSYTLKNTLAKNFRFNIVLRLGNATIATREIQILSNQTINVQMNANFPPVPQNEPPKSITLIGPVGTTDDTLIAFFLANLKVTVFAL